MKIKEIKLIVRNESTMNRAISGEKLENYHGISDSVPQKAVEIWSFGYKYGNMEADAIFDVRFLPNPFYIENLRYLTGKDTICAAYVLQDSKAVRFVDSLAMLIESIRAAADAHKKPVIKIAIGCTGGQHRSVSIAEAVAKKLKNLETSMHAGAHRGTSPRNQKLGAFRKICFSIEALFEMRNLSPMAVPTY